MFYVYMLCCSDNSYYVGHTDALEKRMAQHASGAFPGSYTFSRRPVRLVFVEHFPAREQALAMERRIKGWSRAKKAALIKRDRSEISKLARKR